jgi:tetraacyldisaccharide 4'-kinase
MRPLRFHALAGGESLDPFAFARRFPSVHAVAGIGNPSRFAATLAEAGVHAEVYAYPDHHAYDGSEVVFDDDRPVVVTEKDAVKLRRLTPDAEVWWLEVDVVLSEAARERIAATLHKHGILQHE